jgi:hypothetical protein
MEIGVGQSNAMSKPALINMLEPRLATQASALQKTRREQARL